MSSFTVLPDDLRREALGGVDRQAEKLVDIALAVGCREFDQIAKMPFFTAAIDVIAEACVSCHRRWWPTSCHF